MLKIYNTLTARKEVFRARQRGRVGMYVCGVTVYDYCHLGHARSAVVFDVIARYLRHRGYRVKYVRNFTDVDDKIIQRAAQEGTDWKAITERYIEAYHQDMERLGVARATVEPLATAHIPDMIRIIQTLLGKGMAYEVSGNVYFSVGCFGEYGKLSKRKKEEMISGARVEVDEAKRDPLDFVLWKRSKPGEPAWESPWGPGRPGWHIECSTMSMRYLGPTFDIHGGGQDLIFPHHENEIAQSEGCTRKPFARYWVHNGFVTVDQEKMSKSLGNFFTIREIFEKSGYPPPVTKEILRYFLLSTHYRRPIDFSDQALELAKGALDHFYILFQRLQEAGGGPGRADGRMREILAGFEKAFNQAMDDDFNTPSAIAQLHRLRTEANRYLQRGLSARLAHRLREVFRKYGGILGMLDLEPETYTFRRQLRMQIAAAAVTESRVAPAAGRGPLLGDTEIQRLVAERAEARRKKDWARADAIRQELAAAGVTLEDRPDGTTRVRR